jgi:hypothetical protein
MNQDELFRRLKRAGQDWVGGVAGAGAGYAAGRRADPGKGALYTFVGAAVGQTIQVGLKYFANTDPTDAQIRRFFEERASLVYLVRGKDNGRPAWHYVLIAKPKLDAFKRKLATGSMDVSQYGAVLYSGWGQNPDSATVARIRSEYAV